MILKINSISSSPITKKPEARESIKPKSPNKCTKDPNITDWLAWFSYPKEPRRGYPRKIDGTITTKHSKKILNTFNDSTLTLEVKKKSKIYSEKKKRNKLMHRLSMVDIIMAFLNNIISLVLAKYG